MNGLRGALLGTIAVLAAAPAAAQDGTTDEGNVVDDSYIVGNVAALNRAQDFKQNSDTVTDSIATMDIGLFADRTRDAGLSRIAGVTVLPADSRGLFDGLVSVRGLPWIARTTDGHAEPLLPSTLYDSPRSTMLLSGITLGNIQVSKTRNAKTIEGGIGGSVEYRTQKPFDFGWRMFAVNAGVTANDSGGIGRQAAGLASDRVNVGHGQIGWLAALDWSSDRPRRDTVLLSGNGRDSGRLDRLSGNVGLQWWTDEDWTVTLSASSVRADPFQTWHDRITDGTDTIERTGSERRHLRNNSAGLEVRYEHSAEWTFAAAADFGETLAVRGGQQIEAGAAGVTVTDTAARGIAQLWSYRFDGTYRFLWDNHFAFGFRGTSGKSTTSSGDTIRQDTYAGYAQLEFDQFWGDTPLKGNAGVRVVQTETASGPGRIALSALSGSCIAPPATSCTDFDQAAAFLESGGTIATAIVRNGYTSVLPSFNLTAELINHFQLRFAFSQAIARPDLTDLASVVAPSFSFGDTPATVGTFAAAPAGAAGNPGLKPMRSDNFDLSAEYYFNPYSNLTLGLFHKELHGVFEAGTKTMRVTNNGITYDFATATVVNGGGDRLDGLEFGAQHAFYDLPEPFDRFAAQVNYTLTDSSRPLEGLARHSVNAVLIFEGYGIESRIAWHWQSRARIGTLTDAQPQWADSGGGLDGAVWYEFLDSYRIGLQATNLTGSDRRYDAGTTPTLFSTVTGERTLTLSLYAQL